MKSNTYAGDRNHGTFRHDGNVLKPLHSNKNIQDESIKPNIWWYNIGKNKTTKDCFAHNHPAIFPEQLAHDHIISWSNEGDIVLDPMCGSGTTCKMAFINNRHYIGIDCAEEYCELSRKRIQLTTKQLEVGYV